MQYSRFGHTGLIVSRMALGTMTFGHYEENGFASTVSERDARRMVDLALEEGVNLFDTADGYGAGQSEEILGRALGDRRKDVILVTKVSSRTAPAVLRAGLSRKHLLDACDASLKRLGTDYLDLYLLQNYDPNTPLEETARALHDLQQQGKIRYAGISNFQAWQAEKLMGIQSRLGFAPLAGTQNYYSLLDREVEREILPQARAAGLGVMVWGPLAGGYLTGKYGHEGAQDEEPGRRTTYDFPPIDPPRAREVVDRISKIGLAHDMSPAQVALAWLYRRPSVDTVLIGVSNILQLKTNLKSAHLQLESDELRSIDRVSAPPARYPQWVQGEDATIKEALESGWTPAS